MARKKKPKYRVGQNPNSWGAGSKALGLAHPWRSVYGNINRSIENGFKFTTK